MPSELTQSRRSAAVPDEVLHEYPAVGKYRVRIVQKKSGRPGSATFDMREYVSSEKFEGFTRRGIRLAGRAQLDALREILQDASERDCFALSPAEERASA